MAENKKMAKIGLMTGAVDSLIFASKWTKNENQVVFFVPERTNEEKWAKSFLPAENVATYNKDKKLSMAILDFEGIIKNSDITKRLRNLGVKYFILHHSVSGFLNDWQKKSKIKLIASDFKWHKLEDKIFFDRFLNKHNLPKPQSEIYFWGKKNIKIKGKLVLQDPLSEGGEGTYFIDQALDIENFFEKTKLSRQKKYLLRKYADGSSFGVTIFVSSGPIAVSAIRSQCYEKTNKSNRRRFLGVQWISAKSISQKIKADLNKVFFSLGESLKKSGFFGYASIDFIIGEDNKIYIIECNPRFSASTAQLLQFPQTIGGLNTANLYFDYFFGKRKIFSKGKYSGLQNSKFKGSILHIETPDYKKNYPIIRQYKNGIYQLNKGKISFLTPDITKLDGKGDKFIYYSDAEKGEKIENSTVIGLVISNFPLYSNSGEINNNGICILKKFKLI